MTQSSCHEAPFGSPAHHMMPLAMVPLPCCQKLLLRVMLVQAWALFCVVANQENVPISVCYWSHGRYWPDIACLRAS